MSAPIRTAVRGPPVGVAIEPFLGLVERRLGLRLTHHKLARLEELIAAFLERTEHASALELYEALGAGRHPQLFRELATQLTIGETHFFRVAPQIEALRRTVLPDLLRRRAESRRLRLWSAGCSTGEEAYTLAILLREALAAVDDWDVTVLATDLNEAALASAREALYSAWSFRDTPEAVRRRYFRPEGDRWRLIDPVRRMVSFAPLNLAADRLPSPGPTGPALDLVLCRNVTIYFSPEATRRLYRRLAEALCPDGWLVLGPSDPTPEPSESLAAVALPGAVLWRRIATAPPGRPDRSPPAPTPTREIGEVSRWTPAVAAPRSGAMVADVAAVRALAESGDRLGALEAARSLALARPLEAEAHLLLGLLHLDGGASDAAVESLRRAAFLDGEGPLTQFGLGRAYSTLGQRGPASVAFRRASWLLAAAEDDVPVRGGGALLAGELRQAVEAELARVTGAEGT